MVSGVVVGAVRWSREGVLMELNILLMELNASLLELNGAK